MRSAAECADSPFVLSGASPNDTTAANAALRIHRLDSSACVILFRSPCPGLAMIRIKSFLRQASNTSTANLRRDRRIRSIGPPDGHNPGLARGKAINRREYQRYADWAHGRQDTNGFADPLA